jgi:hypothetical protein
VSLTDVRVLTDRTHEIQGTEADFWTNWENYTMTRLQLHPPPHDSKQCAVCEKVQVLRSFKERILELEVDEKKALDRFQSQDSTAVRVEYDKLVTRDVAESEDRRIHDALLDLQDLRLKMNDALISLWTLLGHPGIMMDKYTDPIKVGNVSELHGLNKQIYGSVRIVIRFQTLEITHGQ